MKEMRCVELSCTVGMQGKSVLNGWSPRRHGSTKTKAVPLGKSKPPTNFTVTNA